MTPARLRIPPLAHFVWFGTSFPWANALALRSAIARGGFDRVVLHHADDLSGSTDFRALAGTDRLEFRRLVPEEVFARCGDRSAALSRLFERLRTPAARADLVRLAVLYAEGGVYLDMDTVTIASLSALCAAADAFCGAERIAIPVGAARSMNPLVRLGRIARGVVRTGCRLAPGGWEAFRAIERYYPLGANNAVLASAAGARFVTRLLDRAIVLPPKLQLSRYGLGPHLVQEIVPEFRMPELAVFPPEYFYPLGPEISAHWFRISNEKPPLARVLSKETRVVHWYASVRTEHVLPQLGPHYVLEHADRQLFSALAAPFVER